jgi:hypothetical protein
MILIAAFVFIQVTLASLLPYILQIFQDATGSKWGPLMILVSGWVVQLLSEDSKFPVSLPARWNSNVWKPVTVVVASMVQATVVSIVRGHTDPVHAILLGLRTAMWSMGIWALFIKAIYNGKPPQWLNYLSLILPEPTVPMNVVEREAVTLSGEDAKELRQFAKPPLPPKSPPPGAA